MSKISLISFWTIVTCVVLTFAATPFKHPGVLISHSQLEHIKSKLTSEPWKTAYKHMTESKYASLSFKPNPRKIVECGSYSNPNHGCSDERESAMAAYTHALIWYFTGNKTHAEKAIDIMHAWSAELTGHTNHNAPLQAGWSGASWPRAAEIIKHTNAGWSNDKMKQFDNMLRHVYLPVVSKGSNSNGNWELVMTEATGAIAVYLDDHEMFDRAVSLWRHRVPAYIYLKSDGAHPVPPPHSNKHSTEEIIAYWYHQHTFVDGLAQETCRDFSHTTFGIAAAINLAETAFHQGLDLYKEGHERFVKAYEFHANYILGAPVPHWLCGGKLNTKPDQTFEIGYNHFHNREKVNLPKTQELLLKHMRPTGPDNHFIAWETLTHADNPNN